MSWDGHGREVTVSVGSVATRDVGDFVLVVWDR